ncbi:hypothetical protein LOD99_5248 [Oopsacas minuta]|uniref:Uncharacterized protein n=1 Tax=Oopsacas minuta TaxID=111878 RepID=A0AAV7JRC1_9METZ|nr:hypothetical protein LOD99_5248 [Oopsacas minuta]
MEYRASTQGERVRNAQGHQRKKFSKLSHNYELIKIEITSSSEDEYIALYLSDIPKQPRIKFPTTKFGEKLRSFNPDWYKTYSWLEYSVNRDTAY